MNSITVNAPAKVNLFLKVLGQRKDSYHNILTIFERISLADTIKISKIPKGIIVKSDKPITLDVKDNLCFKAAEAVLRRGKVKSGVKIEIKKRIPVSSGLGGGSSDAASTIVGVNRLFKLRLDGEALLTIGKRLGADVPFFLLDTPFAMGRGRGDILEIVKSKIKFWHLIIKAGFKTATKNIYGAFDASVNSASNPELAEGFDTEPAGTPKRLTLRPFGRLMVDGELLPNHRHGSGSSAVVRQAHHSSGHPERSRGKLLSKRLTLRRGDVRMFSPSKLRMDYTQAESILYNDLERAVSLKKGVISRISKSLAQLLGKKMIVSGSGPSLFCLYRTRREAIKARDLVLKSVPERERSEWQIFIVKTS